MLVVIFDDANSISWNINHETHELHEKENSEWKLTLFRDESYSIIGACFEVYKEKGCGFLEAVYQERPGLEFDLRMLPYQAFAPLNLTYKGIQLKQKYTPDFICFGKIIVELKAVSDLADEHRAQVHNYLRATGYWLGLLIKFAHYPKLQYERIVI